MHEIFKLPIRYLNRKLSDGGAQSGFGDVPEVLVPVHERSQPGVFKLLLSPQLRQTIEIARDTEATVPYDRVNVKQRAVGVEYDCLGGQWHHVPAVIATNEGR
jgi:hypothetical protein